MSAAGFVDVTVQEYRLPIGPWPKDEGLRKSGLLNLMAMQEGLHGISAAMFTRSLKWSTEEMEVLLAKVRAEWNDRRVHSWWPM